MMPLARPLACLLLLTASLGARPPRDGVGIERPRSCARCGMDRVRFAQSRMLLLHEDGATTGVCSLRCASELLADPKAGSVRRLQVADRAHPGTLVDAKAATWVIGGDLPGVMASTATWAFADPAQAQAFLRRHGGRVADFQAALGVVRQAGGM